ncbi:MAG: hypothetical protein M0P91_13985 [Sulfuricurvum sp.]|jgi:hypothetical protein|uniref:hypothetical protein n=1 Tax=Sulfuricurvum sp. TaxID=2025608 RepID=UPI0025CC08DE|nr:hypothetical protein [Sulfuricurvum sp.]MCK9374287.1 hypothetical protein [Sulfuricurvum sp.]
MILTLHTTDKIVRIDITADQFSRLRDPSITVEEIAAIATQCGVDPAVLIDYTADLKKTAQEMMEIDGSCDYSDHL